MIYGRLKFKWKQLSTCIVTVFIFLSGLSMVLILTVDVLKGDYYQIDYNNTSLPIALHLCDCMWAELQAIST